MELGTFSLSLAVKDIGKSRLFYENLGFEIFAGDQSQNWLIMKNSDHVIGLFQGMFEKNIMTFNPGWDKNGQELESYTDIRKLNEEIKAKGINVLREEISEEQGPANFAIEDPDGNMIFFDQHV